MMPEHDFPKPDLWMTVYLEAGYRELLRTWIKEQRWSSVEGVIQDCIRSGSYRALSTVFDELEVPQGIIKQRIAFYQLVGSKQCSHMK